MGDRRTALPRYLLRGLHGRDGAAVSAKGRGRVEHSNTRGVMDTRPRFVVAEVEGFPMTGHVPRQARPMLSCSVLDRAYCYLEVARFNEEDVRALGHRRGARQPRQRERQEAIRNRAAGLAAILNADP